MVAVSDTEACVAVDAGSVSYPKITVTGLNITGPDGSQLSGFYSFLPSVLPLVDPGLDVVIEDAAVGTVTAGVMSPVTLITTDALTPGFTYTITQRLLVPGGISGDAVFSAVAIPSTLGTTVDISDLI